jgi:hypothetical protein
MSLYPPDKTNDQGANGKSQENPGANEHANFKRPLFLGPAYTWLWFFTAYAPDSCSGMLAACKIVHNLCVRNKEMTISWCSTKRTKTSRCFAIWRYLRIPHQMVKASGLGRWVQVREVFLMNHRWETGPEVELQQDPWVQVVFSPCYLVAGVQTLLLNLGQPHLSLAVEKAR